MAQSYQSAGDELPQNAGVRVNGKLIRLADMNDDEIFAYRNWRDYANDGHDLAYVLNEMKPVKDDKAYVNVVPILQQWQKNGATLDRGGNLYQVRIRAKPEEFLDWDEPLSRQSKFVKDRLKPVVPKGAKYDQDPKGPAIYSNFKFPSDPINDSKRLMAKGIKGVRYLDEGSRVGKKGTHNYVVFDPDDIEITHKNGVALVKKSDADDRAAFKAKWFELAVRSLPCGDLHTSAPFGITKYDPDESRDEGGLAGPLTAKAARPASRRLDACLSWYDGAIRRIEDTASRRRVLGSRGRRI